MYSYLYKHRNINYNWNKKFMYLKTIHTIAINMAPVLIIETKKMLEYFSPLISLSFFGGIVVLWERLFKLPV